MRVFTPKAQGHHATRLPICVARIFQSPTWQRKGGRVAGRSAASAATTAWKGTSAFENASLAASLARRSSWRKEGISRCRHAHSPVCYW